MPQELINITQEEDLLETWFSSGLFLFSTLGWPDIEDPNSKTFFSVDLSKLVAKSYYR